MNLSEVVHWTTLLSSAAAACWLSQLVWFGLWRKYIWLFGFFLTDILETLFLSGLSTRSHGYGDIYVVGQTVKAILAIASSIQLWLLVLAVYPGLARFGRRIMIYLMGIAVLVGAAGYALQPPRSGALSSFLHHFNAVEGSVASMLAVFLVAATLFLLWFPVEAPRNQVILIAGFVFLCLQQWATLLLLNLHPEATAGLSLVTISFETACLILWMVTVRPKGEIVTAVTGHRWNPGEAQRLLGQLKAINARLEHAVQ